MLKHSKHIYNKQEVFMVFLMLIFENMFLMFFDVCAYTSTKKDVSEVGPSMSSSVDLPRPIDLAQAVGRDSAAPGRCKTTIGV